MKNVKKDEIYFALISRIRFPHVQTESVGFSDGVLYLFHLRLLKIPYELIDLYEFT